MASARSDRCATQTAQEYGRSGMGAGRSATEQDQAVDVRLAQQRQQRRWVDRDSVGRQRDGEVGDRRLAVEAAQRLPFQRPAVALLRPDRVERPNVPADRVEYDGSWDVGSPIRL